MQGMLHNEVDICNGRFQSRDQKLPDDYDDDLIMW